LFLFNIQAFASLLAASRIVHASMDVPLERAGQHSLVAVRRPELPRRATVGFLLWRRGGRAVWATKTSSTELLR